MTLKKFAVDYSKIKNDGPKVAVPCTAAAYLVGDARDVQNQILDEIDQAAAVLEDKPECTLRVPMRRGFHIKLSKKVAALYHIQYAVELIRELKKANRDSVTKSPTVNWFRGYYAHFGLRMRCNSTTKYYVELHLGAQGWQTWQMLLGLGYTPYEDAFWLELDGFICAQSMPVAAMADVSGDLFVGVV